MLKSLAAAGLLVMGLVFVAPASASIDVFAQCRGPKQQVIACCERTKKPRSWFEESASCRRNVSCGPVTRDGRRIEECRIRRANGFGPFTR